jgi:hypothetical protein
MGTSFDLTSCIFTCFWSPFQVIEMNKWALSQLPNGRLEIVPGATHLFEEGDTLQQCGILARDWLSANFDAAIQS